MFDAIPRNGGDMPRVIAVCLTCLLGLAAHAGAEGKVYGKPLRGLAPASLADVLAKPEAGQVVRLEGTIDKVCRNKGCWLELKQGKSAVHVTFEGYSFFVPTTSAGQPVVLEGRVLVKEPARSDVAHKQSEGAGAAAGARVSIEATGVEIR
jgi:Domain of unknown function (DUF4920)